MSLKGGLAGGSGSAVHEPRISRSLVDQLESHLSALGVPAVETSDRRGRQNDGSRSLAISRAPIQFRIEKLESALICVKKAAKAMAELEEQAADDRAGMQEALAALERRLHGYEQEFATLSEQLQDARRETEEHRQRSLSAESKLDRLMAAVAKMIAPLDAAGVVTRHRPPPALRGSLTNDGVSV